MNTNELAQKLQQLAETNPQAAEALAKEIDKDLTTINAKLQVQADLLSISPLFGTVSYVIPKSLYGEPLVALAGAREPHEILTLINRSGELTTMLAYSSRQYSNHWIPKGAETTYEPAGPVTETDSVTITAPESRLPPRVHWTVPNPTQLPGKLLTIAVDMKPGPGLTTVAHHVTQLPFTGTLQYHGPFSVTGTEGFDSPNIPKFRTSYGTGRVTEHLHAIELRGAFNLLRDIDKFRRDRETERLRLIHEREEVLSKTTTYDNSPPTESEVAAYNRQNLRAGTNLQTVALNRPHAKAEWDALGILKWGNNHLAWAKDYLTRHGLEPDGEYSYGSRWL